MSNFVLKMRYIQLLHFSQM